MSRWFVVFFYSFFWEGTGKAMVWWMLEILDSGLGMVLVMQAVPDRHLVVRVWRCEWPDIPQELEIASLFSTESR